MFWTIVLAILFILLLPILFYLVLSLIIFLIVGASSPFLLIHWLFSKISPKYKKEWEKHHNKKAFTLPLEGDEDLDLSKRYQI